MNINKLLIGAAAIAMPVGIAHAQSATSPATSTSPSAAVSASTVPSDAAPSTDSSAPSASTSDTSTSTAPTTTADASATTSSAQPMAVTKADLTKGATVHGSDGGVVGKIESVSADGAVVSTGKTRAQIPTASFGKTDKGLVIAMSKTQLEAAASAKSPS